MALTLAAIGLWILSIAHTLPMAIVGGFLVGSCFAMHNTAFYTIAPANAHPARRSLSMSWYTVAMNLGMVLCPMVVTTIAASVFGPAIANCFMVGAIIVSVVAALSWFVPSLLKDCQLTID